MDSEPRAQYYLYAHRVLPTLFYQNPQQFLSILSTDGIAFLRFFWDRAVHEGIDSLPPSGLNFETRALENGTIIAVIELPTPGFATEAYFVAPVFRDAGSEQPPTLRYFTLEYGITFAEQKSRTVLCEWTPDGTHRNFGDGPPPQSKPFLDAVIAHL